MEEVVNPKLRLQALPDADKHRRTLTFPFMSTSFNMNKGVCDVCYKMYAIRDLA